MNNNMTKSVSALFFTHSTSNITHSDGDRTYMHGIRSWLWHVKMKKGYRIKDIREKVRKMKKEDTGTPGEEHEWMMKWWYYFTLSFLLYTYPPQRDLSATDCRCWSPVKTWHRENVWFYKGWTESLMLWSTENVLTNSHTYNRKFDRNHLSAARRL